VRAARVFIARSGRRADLFGFPSPRRLESKKVGSSHVISAEREGNKNQRQRAAQKTAAKVQEKLALCR
jgi:hypothetical protein